jgi:UDP-N-acetylmuramoyl-L-alanyl-D-glutamate--2,6-diaminopimelate ligase
VLLQGGDPEVTGIATDSRQVVPGDLFVALRGGEEQDRHPFVPDAVTRGAVAALVEAPVETPSAAIVRVRSVRAALPQVAERFYGFPADALETVVGITGTNGKTTTAYLIHAILAAAGLRPGLIGTVEYLIGKGRRASTNSTPEAHQLQRMLREMVEAGCRSAVMEATSHGLALKRVDRIRFDIAVFTNLTRDHLDFHKTPESYLAAKATLFENLDRGARAVVNADDPATPQLLSRCRAGATRYGTHGDADVRILTGTSDWRGTRLTLDTPAGRLSPELALRGRFNLWNTAAAISAGLAADVAAETVLAAIREVRVPGRFEGVDCGQPFGVFVDYAHTPDALQNVLQAARELTEGRVISVFGCGGDRDRGKRPEMGRISAELADLSVVTSDNPRTEDPDAIIRDILPGIGDAAHRVDADRRRAIEAGIRNSEPGDVVVIAGKGHEDYQILGREKVHFDDREVAGEVLAELGYTEDGGMGR